MKDVKIVIGANFGDESKGLVSHYFSKEALSLGTTPITVFHNGTAQRGHTVDYSPTFRHIYHHFGCGTAEKTPTYFADTFLIHPMEFRREYEEELYPNKIIPPICYCNPEAKVITPFDMVVDHATEEHIAIMNGMREYGSCGYGSWCAAEDRIPMGRTVYTIKDFSNIAAIPFLLDEIWKDCLTILVKRGVDLERTSFAHVLKDRTAIVNNFINDIKFFLRHILFANFDVIWKNFDSIIFENGQGLGLDMNVDNPWHTTSNTGLTNPYNMIKNYNDFNAEVCYTTRSYLTRHGIGPLEEEVKKADININMIDKTNVHNEFQGSLRYGYLEDNDQKNRIAKDFSIVANDLRFSKSMVITHCNEFDCENDNSRYYSDNPFGMKTRD